jgi:hypothetical protein
VRATLRRERRVPLLFCVHPASRRSTACARTRQGTRRWLVGRVSLGVDQERVMERAPYPRIMQRAPSPSHPRRRRLSKRGIICDLPVPFLRKMAYHIWYANCSFFYLYTHTLLAGRTYCGGPTPGSIEELAAGVGRARVPARRHEAPSRDERGSGRRVRRVAMASSCAFGCLLYYIQQKSGVCVQDRSQDFSRCVTF